MNNEIALKIRYYLITKNNDEIYGEEDFLQFKEDLQKEYVTTIETKVGERGGGHFIIEFLINLSLKDFLLIILGGAAWDLVKIGARKLMLRPFIHLYENFLTKKYSHNIGDVIFTFSDTKLHIYSVADGESEIGISNFSRIFQSLAKNYRNLDIVRTNKLTDIHIPIIKDDISLGRTVYRQTLEVDELLYFSHPEMKFTDDTYFGYWGLEYFKYNKMVYDVQKKILFEEKWLSEDDYFDLEQKNKST